MVSTATRSGLARGFATASLVGLSGLALIAVGQYTAEQRAARTQVSAAERADMEIARGMLGADIAAAATDLLVLARHVEEMVPDRASAAGLADLGRIFVVFAEQKRLYDQIRFIAPDGREQLRVNLQDGRARLVPRWRLQDKSQRYYVTEALRTSASRIYLSPLDLNVENGRIERPFKPMMRLATPTSDAAGETTGIVVLNYRAQPMLDELAAVSSRGLGSVELLNADGFWLRARNAGDAWGFMLGHGRRFQDQHPELWERIKNSEQGQFLTDAGLVTFASLDLRQVTAEAMRRIDAVAADPVVAPSGDGVWRLVSMVPTPLLGPTLARFFAEQWLFYAGLLALIVIGSLVLARSRERHRRAEIQGAYERRFRQTLEQIHLAAVALDRGGRLLFCNQFFLDLVGSRADETIGANWLERFAPRAAREDIANIIDQLQDPEHFPRNFTCPVLTSSGQERMLAWHTSINADADGGVVGVTAIGEDITDKQRSEAAVRKLSRAVEQSPSIVVITDRQGRIEYVNPKFTEVTGYTLNEVIGRSPRLLKSGETAPEEYSALWHNISHGREWRGEFHNRRKNGGLYWESASISALRDGNGTITHFLAVKEDITDRKRLQREVAAQNQQLVRAEALAEVGRVATMIAHDLRNPLSSIKVAVDVLARPGTSPEDAHELHDIAREQVVYMEAIMTDMLSYARPQQPRVEWLNAERLLQTTLDTLARRLRDACVQVSVDAVPGLPTLPGDPNQLQQLFTNLIINALQAMESVPEARRELAITSAMELGPDGTGVRFGICDSGAGIQGDPDALFEPFVTHRAKGTGLGLAIVRRIAEAHGGRVRLESCPDGGACAVLVLPTVPPQAADATAAERPLEARST